jgi:GntR family galactonate operon transcriptional repressor
MAVTPAPAESALQRVVLELGSQIVRGVYRPGEAIPIEAALSGSLSVGRNVLREAVKLLAGKGLLRANRRQGTRVRPQQDWNLLDPDILSWLTADDAAMRRFLYDLTELRAILEPQAAALAAERAAPEEVDRLWQAVARMERAPQSMADVVEPDVDFHVTLLRASHNALIAEFAKAVAVLLRTNFQITIQRLGQHEINADNHRRVVERIALRDADGARAAALDHLRRNREQAQALRQGGRFEPDPARVFDRRQAGPPPE